MFGKRNRTKSGTSGSDGSVKIFLDVAKGPADWFPPLKSTLGGVNSLVKHYEVWTEYTTVVHS